MSRILCAGLVAILLALSAGSNAIAQTKWDSPMLMPPNPMGKLGVYLVDPADLNTGVLATYRPAGKLGFRLGIADGPGQDDLTIFGGAEMTRILRPASDDFPLDIAWFVGAGAGLGDYTIISVPVGLTLGNTITGDGVNFTPYFGLKVAMDVYLGDARPRDDLDMDIAVDLGIDLQFQGGWIIRFGGSFGDRGAVAIGLVF